MIQRWQRLFIIGLTLQDSRQCKQQSKMRLEIYLEMFPKSQGQLPLQNIAERKPANLQVIYRTKKFCKKIS